jgi:hypothetical protein
VHGWSDFSDTFSIQAATVPDSGSAPTTAISNEDVRITWSAPASDGSNTITAYHIYIKDSLAAY